MDGGGNYRRGQRPRRHRPGEGRSEVNVNLRADSERFYVVPEHRHQQPPLIKLYAGPLTVQMTMEEAARLVTYLSAAIVAANDTERRIKGAKPRLDTCSECGTQVDNIIGC